MSNKEFLKLRLMIGQVILLHLDSGNTICGSYRGNYDVNSKQFDFENHKTNQLEKVSLDSINEFVT